MLRMRRIGDVSMQVASGERVDEGTSVPVGQIATLVEECECPEGYTGLSCEVSTWMKCCLGLCCLVCFCHEHVVWL